MKKLTKKEVFQKKMFLNHTIAESLRFYQETGNGFHLGVAEAAKKMLLEVR